MFHSHNTQAQVYHCFLLNNMLHSNHKFLEFADAKNYSDCFSIFLEIVKIYYDVQNKYYMRTKLLKLNTVWYGRALPAETKHSRWVKPPFGNSKIKRAWTTFLLETISVIYTSRLFVHSGQDLCMKRKRRGLCVLKIQLGNDVKLHWW